MITLEKLNMQEGELNDVLSFVYEVEHPEDAANYQKFIKEDASLDQKLNLLEKEGVTSADDLASKLINLSAKKCKASCNEATTVWGRMRNSAQCHADEAMKMVAFVENTSGDEILIAEWTRKLEMAQEKVLEYEAKFDDKVLQEGGWKTIFGFFLLGPYGWAAYRGIRAAMSEKSKRCGVLAIGRTRDVCLWKARQEENVKMSSLIKKEMKNCSQSKNPDKCKSQGAAKAAKFDEKARKFAEKIKSYQMKGPKKAGKAEAGLKKYDDPKAKVV